MSKIIPVLLAGGRGSRLWPASRKAFPKQFSNLLEGKSLFQETVLRLETLKAPQIKAPIIMTNDDFRFIVLDQLKEVSALASSIVLEPEGKNTAASILAATLLSLEEGDDVVLAVFPTDHKIEGLDLFNAAIFEALQCVEETDLVTFGVTPTRPETGFGYMRVNDKRGRVCQVAEFHEKPALDVAKTMLASELYLWNSGIFVFKAAKMVEFFLQHAPVLADQVKQSLKESIFDLGFQRLNQKTWSKINSESFDHVIVEKLQNIKTVRWDAAWSDLGDWKAVWEHSKKNEEGVSVSENSHAIECENTLLRSENSGQQIVGLGLENIFAVATRDAVLVVDKNKTQDVRSVVDHLNDNGYRQATEFTKDFRPWGWFERLGEGAGFQVKQIYVKPGGSLSLQTHQFRSEHWIVTEGVAKVTIGDRVEILRSGQSAYIPVGELHRLENEGPEPMILIEVQTGSYFGEDDIRRYSDIYRRDGLECD